MDGRIKARLRALAVEPPEAAHVALGVAGHRLGEIAGRRRHRADDGERAFAAGKRRHLGGALVEFGQPRAEIGGVGGFARQFAEPAGHFAQGFRPAAGGIRHQRDMQALVAEIFADGDGGVDRGLARGHRHVGGIGDDDGALHQAAAGARIGELGKFAQHFRHLVAALAAADIDDDVGVAPFRQRLLQHGLAGAEAAGNGGLAAARDRKQGVEDALAGDHRRVGGQTLRAPAAPGGSASAGKSRFRAFRRSRVLTVQSVASAAYVPSATIVSTVPLTSGGSRMRCCDAVAGQFADGRAGRQRVAGLHQWREGEVAVGLGVERPQQPVEDAAEQIRARAVPTAPRRCRARRRPAACRWCPRRPGRPARRPSGGSLRRGGARARPRSPRRRGIRLCTRA